MKEVLIYYWLIRAASTSQPSQAYEYCAFAVQTYYDDPVSVKWIYENVVAADALKKGGAK